MVMPETLKHITQNHTHTMGTHTGPVLKGVYRFIYTKKVNFQTEPTVYKDNNAVSTGMAEEGGIHPGHLGLYVVRVKTVNTTRPEDIQIVMNTLQHTHTRHTRAVLMATTHID